jgi:two-component system nitrogen regulation sensor histidine kinase GlnL
MQSNIQFAHLQGAEGYMLMMISPREIASRMTQNVSSAKAAKSAIGMAEMLAHEIKNPLAGITGAAQLLSMGLDGADLELTDLIVAESRRIVKLLEQVEQFGNLRPPALRPVNIHDVLDRARQSAAVGFAAHMHLVEDYDPSLPRALADGDQLLQVFLNLLRNAAEACRDGGTIRLHTFYEPSLRVRRKDGTRARLPLQIEVIDDGPGLPPDIAGDVFEPFVSGRENGTGLGLALVSKLVGDAGGWISVDSVPGRTVFRVSLPLAPKDAGDPPHD